LRRQHQKWFDDDTAVGELPTFADGFDQLRVATLPAVVEEAIERYERVGDARRAFLWRWAWHGIRNTQLSVVPEPWRDHVDATKLLAVVVNVLFDDLADIPGPTCRTAWDIMVFATLDLMAAPDAGDASSVDIGVVREVAWHAQALTQIAKRSPVGRPRSTSSTTSAA
jgi:hypothetical protein